MSGRTTASLAITLTVLLVAYWLTGSIDRSVEQRVENAKRLFDFDADAITTLSIAQAGRDTVEAMRSEDGAWTIIAPYDFIPPNEPLWEQVAATLSNLSNERTLEESPTNLDAYELDAPRLTVIAGTNDGQLVQLSFGALDPTKNNRYTQRGTGEVFLTPAPAYSMFDRPLVSLRDTRLYPLAVEGVSRMRYVRHPVRTDDDVELANAAQALPIDETYERESDGTWRIVAPVAGHGYAPALEALAAQLRFSITGGFVDAPLSLGDYGLSTPFAEITLYDLKGDSAGTLHFGWLDDQSQEGGIFVKRDDSPSVFTIDSHVVTLLPQAPQAFRERRLFTREAKNLQSIRYTDTQRTLLLEADTTTGWKVSEPTIDDSDQIAISWYISALKIIVGHDFPEVDADAVLASPRLRLDLAFADGQNTSVVVGAPVPDSDPVEFYARQDNGTFTTISFKALRVLQADLFQFRNKDLLSFSVDKATAVNLAIGDEEYAFERHGGRWAVLEPANSLFESQSDMASLLQALAEAHARGIADPPPSADVQGLDEPVLVVSVTLESGDTIGPLRVGSLKAPSSRERFSRVEGRDDVYFVDQGLMDDLREALRGVVPLS